MIHIFSVIFFIFAHGSTLECQDPSSEAQRELFEKSCEINDIISSCSTLKTSPPHLNSIIDQKLSNSYKNKKQIQDSWLVYKNSSWGEMFSLENSEQGTAFKKPTHLLDWVAPQNDNDDYRAKLKSMIISQYTQFGDKNECMPIVKSKEYQVRFPDRNFSSQNEVTNHLKAKEYTKDREAYFNTLSKASQNEVSICNPHSLSTTGFHAIAETIPPCSAVLTHLFPDNQWNARSLLENSSSPEALSMQSCIKNALQNGATIKSVVVQSSSSGLNNTGAAADKFCKKGFLSLSRARAENVRNQILPTLLGNDLRSQVAPGQIVLDYQGANGDGTSGPCPYFIHSREEYLINKYQTEEGKRELDQYKYTKVHVNFFPPEKPLSPQTTEYAARYTCRKIYFECEVKKSFTKE
jgi:hypothetical protein